MNPSKIKSTERKLVYVSEAMFVVTTSEDGGTVEWTTKWTADSSRRLSILGISKPPTKPVHIIKAHIPAYRLTALIGETQLYTWVGSNFWNKRLRKGSQLVGHIMPIVTFMYRFTMKKGKLYLSSLESLSPDNYNTID